MLSRDKRYPMSDPPQRWQPFAQNTLMDPSTHLYEREILAQGSVLMEGKEHRMAISDLERLIEDWALAWSSPNTLEKLLSLVTEDCIYEDVSGETITHGKTELEQLYRAAHDAFPNYKITLTSHVVALHRAGAEWVKTGRQQGDLPGLPATNKPYTLRGASTFELQDNQVRRCSDYSDMVTLLKQLGVYPVESNS